MFSCQKIAISKKNATVKIEKGKTSGGASKLVGMRSAAETTSVDERKSAAGQQHTDLFLEMK
jgi:hypothetical protein